MTENFGLAHTRPEGGKVPPEDLAYRTDAGAAQRHENPSGIRPTEYKVLIDPTPVESKIGSIYIPDEAMEKEKFAQIKGRIVAVSPHAFSYEDKHAWEEAGIVKPKPGDVAIYAKYLGIRVKGKDGKEYLLVNDKDICAIIEE